MHESSWHVLFVIANHEKRVSQHLMARSVEHYLPLYTERSRWTDRWVTVERPLFTGYVFVRFSFGTKLSVISTPGVIRLLGDDDRETVSPQEIERIHKGLASGYLLRPHPCARVGTPVRVRNGVFEGAEGIVTEFRRSCRVVIALAAIRQCFSIEVDLRDVEVLRRTSNGSEIGRERGAAEESLEVPAHYQYRSEREQFFITDPQR